MVYIKNNIIVNNIYVLRVAKMKNILFIYHTIIIIIMVVMIIGHV